jgi:uncharacterized protein
MTIRLARQKSTNQPYPLEPTKFARHAAILAQSGSGKSFLMGRLIEELALSTKARIVIFDPNSDFIRLPQPDAGVWQDEKFARSFFPDESCEDFQNTWSTMKISIASNHNLDNARGLRLEWGRFSDLEMASVMNIDVKRQSDLYQCLFLTRQVSDESWSQDEEACFDFDHFKAQWEKVYKYLLTGRGPELVRKNPLAQTLRKTVGTQTALTLKTIVDSLALYQIWLSQGDGGTDVRNLVPGSEEAGRILVVDLQSLTNSDERIAVVNAIMDELWAQARRDLWEVTRDFDKPDTRVPTFIIIDEAHNLVPADKQSPGIRSVSDQIVRVAAEGRKYGLHLIVATQRPRKIDSNVLSECDNLVLMKMTNDSDIKYAEDIFGFLATGVGQKAKTFTVGEFLLAGHFTAGDEILQAAPRRTVQGGRSIPDSSWTSSEGKP